MKAKIAVITILLFILISCAPLPKQGSEAEFNQHLNAGISFLQKGNYPMTKQELSLALNINPKSVRANNLMGLAYFREQNYDYAEIYFQKTVKIDPNFATGYLNLGGVYAMKELFPKAIECYQKALAISPQLTATYYSLGAVCFQMGDQEKGVNYLTKGLEIDPEFLEKHADSLTGLPMKGSALPELYFTYAKLYANRSDIDRTVEYLKKARQFGFKDWKRIEAEREFAGIRQDPRIKEFLR